MTTQVLNTNNQRLQKIVQHSRRLQALEQKILPHLSDAMRSKVKLASIQQDCIKFVVPSGTWATQLRYYFPDLLPQIQSIPALSRITRLECLIVPEDFVAPKPVVQHSVSADTAELLQYTAEITEHEGLSDALLRLSRHVKS